MSDYKEVEYSFKESELKEIYSLCADIIHTDVKYSRDKLAMADKVIASNSLNASTIKSILDERTKP